MRLEITQTPSGLFRVEGLSLNGEPIIYVGVAATTIASIAREIAAVEQEQKLSDEGAKALAIGAEVRRLGLQGR